MLVICTLSSLSSECVLVTSCGCGVHSAHSILHSAAQTQKPREFVSRNERRDDNDKAARRHSAVIIVMVFAKTAGIRECRTKGRTEGRTREGLFVRQLKLSQRPELCRVFESFRG